MYKICKKCKIEKNINEFYKRRICKDGYMGICKSCKNNNKVIIGEKICKKCKVSKDVSNFHKRMENKDGYRNQCKSCVNSRYRHQIVEKKCESCNITKDVSNFWIYN